MSSSTLPPSLKKINVFLKRAEELDRDKSNPECRVLAYNCRQYAVLSGLPLATDNQAKAALSQLLTVLEKEKTPMSVFSKSEHWKICRKMADRVFDKADSDDRAGLASKGTARSFYAAGTFYEVLQQFHDETINNKIGDDLNEDEASVMEHIEEEDQRRIYCKWKATEILNAIKEGRTPTPGGYQQEHAEPDEMAEEAERIERVESKNNLPLPPPPPKFVEIWDAADHDSDANHGMPPPLPPHSYDGIELSLSGHPTSTKTTATTKTDDDITQDMITPVSPPKKQSLSPSPPPPSYSQQHSSNESRSGGGSSSGSNGGGGGGGQGIFSSVFHSKLASSPTSNKKLSKEQMGDAIELTKFALAALQNGDGELGRERLEQALGLWR